MASFDALLIVARQLVCRRLLKQLAMEDRRAFLAGTLSDLQGIHLALKARKPNADALANMLATHVEKYRSAATRERTRRDA